MTTENQIEGYAANITEELSELLRALNNKNEHEVIDALCDIIVFTINLDVINKSDFNVLDIDYKNIRCVEEELIYKFIVNDITHMIRVSADYQFNIFPKEQLLYLGLSAFECVKKCLNAIYQLGYDPLMSMEETIKEISSRTGKWDDGIKKFIKDEKISPYKADYSKCKI